MNTEQEKIIEEDIIDPAVIDEKISTLWNLYVKYQQALDQEIVYNLENKVVLDKEGRRDIQDRRMYLGQLRRSITDLTCFKKNKKGGGSQGSYTFQEVRKGIDNLLPSIKTGGDNEQHV